MRLQKDKTVGLLVDIQERLIPVMHDKERLLTQTKKLLQGLQILKVPVIVSQQYTKGLGMTAPELMEILGTVEYKEKITFSCFREPAIRDVFEADSVRNQVLVFGIEAHICVLQTVLDLLAEGFQPVVVVDCLDSRNPEDKEIALRRMEQAGAWLTTVESCLFELTERGGTDSFRQISRLVK